MKEEVLDRIRTIGQYMDVELPLDLSVQSGGPQERSNQFLLGVAVFLEDLMIALDVPGAEEYFTPPSSEEEEEVNAESELD